MANKTNKLGLTVSVGGYIATMSDDKKFVYWSFKWLEIKYKDGFKYFELDNGAIRWIDQD